MTGAGEKTTPAVADEGGCVWITRRFGLPGVTVKVLLAPLLKPLALAVSCLFVPAESISKFVNATVPLPAAVPISKVARPCKGPTPEVSATLTLRLAGRPRVELFPNGSCDFTTGCVAKAEPAVALPGWVVKTK